MNEAGGAGPDLRLHLVEHGSGTGPEARTAAALTRRPVGGGDPRDVRVRTGAAGGVGRRAPGECPDRRSRPSPIVHGHPVPGHLEEHVIQCGAAQGEVAQLDRRRQTAPSPRVRRQPSPRRWPAPARLPSPPTTSITVDAGPGRRSARSRSPPMRTMIRSAPTWRFSSAGVPSATSRPPSMMPTRSAERVRLLEVLGGEQDRHHPTARLRAADLIPHPGPADRVESRSSARRGRAPPGCGPSAAARSRRRFSHPTRVGARHQPVDRVADVDHRRERVEATIDLVDVEAIEPALQAGAAGGRSASGPAPPPAGQHRCAA